MTFLSKETKAVQDTKDSNEGIMIPPSKFGKAKASLQFWAVGFVMIDFQFNILSFNIADLVVLHALIFSYISGYQYISGYIQKTK